MATSRGEMVRLTLVLFIVVILSFKVYAVLTSDSLVFKSRKSMAVEIANSSLAFFAFTYRRLAGFTAEPFGLHAPSSKKQGLSFRGGTLLYANASNSGLEYTSNTASSSTTSSIASSSSTAPSSVSSSSTTIASTSTSTSTSSVSTSSSSTIVMTSTSSSTSTSIIQSSTSSTSSTSTAPSSTTSLPTTSSSSVSTSILPSTTTTISGNAVVTGVANQTVRSNLTYMSAQNGRAKSTVSVRSGRATISVGTGSVLTELDVRFKNANAINRFNISVANTSNAMGPALPNGRGAYQYIQINQSFYNSTNSVDPYISNVTYNFQVSAAWLSQQGVQAQNITLMKYTSKTGAWNALPTTMTGQDSGSYLYSATSNSFSTYAITFVTNNGTSTSSPLTVIVGGPMTTYFYASGLVNGGGATITFNFTEDVSQFQNAGNGGHAIHSNATIGHSSVPVGEVTDTNVKDMAMAGIGANVLFGNGDFASTTINDEAASTNFNLAFTVNTPGSFAILMGAANSTFKSITLPAGCTKHSQPALSTASAFNANCIFATTGSKTLTIQTNSKATVALAAYIFPPYAVTFNDLPTTANIATNGIDQRNGNTISGLIGMGTINAIAPSGVNSVFSNWAFGGNLIVTDPTAQNTFLVVEGNDVLTANFNSLTTFTETGLPAGTTWNVVYNGVTVYNSPAPNDANVVFDEPWWGNDAFTVPDQGSYIPTPASGNLNEGKTQSISFAASACYISISNTVVDFGQINSGSNVPTANTVTVTDNGGSAAANILVAGGLGSTSPFNGIWLGTSSANQIGIANTLWSAASQGSYSGTAVTNTPVDTMILIPNPGGGTASNTIYFGMGIPGGTPADTYTTNIIVESTC